MTAYRAVLYASALEPVDAPRDDVSTPSYVARYELRRCER